MEQHGRTIHHGRLGTPATRMVGRGLAALVAIALLLPGAADAATGRTIVVAPGGAPGAAGTAEDPLGSVDAALTLARPGDTVVLRGGQYVEDVVVDAADATADLPVVVRAWEGETPVVRGLFWLTSPSYWQLSGVEVTWRDGMSSQSHMVKVTDGVGWSMTGFNNDGQQADAVGSRGVASYTYVLCETGTTVCSLPVTVAFV